MARGALLYDLMFCLRSYVVYTSRKLPGFAYESLDEALVAAFNRLPKWICPNNGQQSRLRVLAHYFNHSEERATDTHGSKWPA
jgi:hypothetical protein